MGYLEPFTFANAPNLVYNSHRYSGTGYLLDNNVNSTDPGPNNLRFIGNLQNFRAKYSVPIWVGETGENTSSWMHDAAVSLNSVGIGWCHWTYKRFGAGPNAALSRINPPYIVDGPAGLPQVLENIKFANCVPNPGVVAAVAPAANGFVNHPGGGNYNGNPGPAAPVGRSIWLRGSNGKYVSGENGAGPMTCTRAAVSATESFSYGLLAPGTVLAGRPAAAGAGGYCPNPVAGRLTYPLPAGGQAHRLTVLDATGRLVLSRSYDNTGAQNTVDLSGLKSGFYLVHLVGPALDTSFKINKQ